jgi:hypothetical protein
VNPERRPGIQRSGRGGFDIAGHYFALVRDDSLLRPETIPEDARRHLGGLPIAMALQN